MVGYEVGALEVARMHRDLCIICDEADGQVGVLPSRERRFWIWKCLYIVSDGGVHFSNVLLFLRARVAADIFVHQQRLVRLVFVCF